MPRSCEVCSSRLADGSSPARAAGRIKQVLVGDRLVALCEVHALGALDAGVETLGELRVLFNEPEGQRSLVDRRAAFDRREFPPRPEGRRRGSGRRVSDG